MNSLVGLAIAFFGSHSAGTDGRSGRETAHTCHM